MKPFSRVISYKRILRQLSSTLPVAHPDNQSAKDCFNLLQIFWSELEPEFIKLSNKHLSDQVRQEIDRIDLEKTENVDLLRKGSLMKLTEKGYEQRLFLIIGNSLIWTGKGISTTSKRFVAHGELKLGEGVELETSEEQPLAFRVGELILSCTSKEERDKWLIDIVGIIESKLVNNVEFVRKTNHTDDFETMPSQTPLVNENNSVQIGINSKI